MECALFVVSTEMHFNGSTVKRIDLIVGMKQRTKCIHQFKGSFPLSGNVQTSGTDLFVMANQGCVVLEGMQIKWLAI